MMDRIGVGEGKLGIGSMAPPCIMNCGFLPVYYIEKWEATVARFYGSVLVFPSFFSFLFYDRGEGGGDFIVETNILRILDHFVFIRKNDTLFVHIFIILIFIYSLYPFIISSRDYNINIRDYYLGI